MCPPRRRLRLHHEAEPQATQEATLYMLRPLKRNDHMQQGISVIAQESQWAVAWDPAGYAVTIAQQLC